VAKGTLGCLGLLCVLAELVLVFWPVPGKYPWGLPGVVLGIAVVSAIRWRNMGAATPFVLGTVAVPLVAAWTLVNILGLGTDVVGYIGVAMVAVPAFCLGVASPGGGPYDD
jgi:hypothetical protein